MVSPTRSPSNAAPTGYYRKALGTAVRHIGGIIPASRTRVSPSLKLRNLTRLFMVIYRSASLWRTHLRAIQFGVERVGNRQIRIRSAVPEDDQYVRRQDR